MTFGSRSTQACCVQLLGFIGVSIGLLAGCPLDQTAGPTTPARSIPDKETYLLSQLQVRFQDPDVHCELGRYYLSEGVLDKARYHIETALGFDPAHRQSQAAFVKVLMAQGNSQQAGQMAARYQQQLLRSPVEMVKLAKAFGEEGLNEYALSCFNKALEADPTSAEANRQLGYYYLIRNDNAHALEYFTQSFKLNPNQPDVAGELGRMGVVVETPKVDVHSASVDTGAVR